MQSSMLHRSKTWPVRKVIEVALQQVEMRNVRLMCDIKVKDRVPSKELTERLGLDDGKTGGVGMDICCEKKTMIG